VLAPTVEQFVRVTHEMVSVDIKWHTKLATRKLRNGNASERRQHPNDELFEKMTLINTRSSAVVNDHPAVTRGADASSGGSRICQGRDHGERAEREPKRGSGAGAPSGVQGRAPGGGQRRSPLKLKAFCSFLYKKVANS